MMIRRLRYWLALKLVPELAVWMRPASALFARATLDMLNAECRYVDPDLRDRLLEIARGPVR